MNAFLRPQQSVDVVTLTSIQRWDQQARRSQEHQESWAEGSTVHLLQTDCFMPNLRPGPYGAAASWVGSPCLGGKDEWSFNSPQSAVGTGNVREREQNPAL